MDERTLEVLKCSFFATPKGTVTVNLRNIVPAPSETAVLAFMNAFVAAGGCASNNVNISAAADKAEVVTTTWEEIYKSENLPE